LDAPAPSPRGDRREGAREGEGEQGDGSTH
jgi:hypothetical protein